MTKNTDPNMNEFCEICKRHIDLEQEYRNYPYGYFVHAHCEDERAA